MAKIKVTSRCEIYDGMTIVFKAPCDCTDVDGLNVYDTTGGKQAFSFRDVHGNDLTGVDDLFVADSYTNVILDTNNGYAYLQNADTNGYLEGEIEDLRESITGKSSTSHGHALTDSVITGTLPVSKGGTGATTAAAALSSLGAQKALGFTPIQQGGGAGQNANKVYIGWSNNHQLKVQVDSTDLGSIHNTYSSMLLGSSQYGTSLPAAGTKGRIFFKKVTT